MENDLARLKLEADLVIANRHTPALADVECEGSHAIYLGRTGE